MRIGFNYNSGVIPEPADAAGRLKTKETVEKRFGSQVPVTMRAGITQDTVTFTAKGATPAKQIFIESFMPYYLRKTDNPFKQT